MTNLLHPVTRFLQWWLSELAALLPSPLRRLVVDQRTDVVLAVQDGKAAFYSLRGDNAALIGDCDLKTDQLPAIIGKQVKKMLPRGGAVTVALPRSSVTIRTGELPLAASENLNEVAGYEMDRLTPFQNDEVYFHADIVGRDLEQQKLQINLTAAPRASVDPLLDRVKSWGLSVDRVDVATGSQGLRQGINLLPATSKGAATFFGHAVTVALLLACAALSFLALSVPLDRKEHYAAALDREVLLARKRLSVVRNLTDEIEALQSSSSYVASLRQDTILVSRILDDMTRLLPDDTWLSQLRLVENRLEITGYSKDAAKLIAVFDASLLFANPKFRSPVTRDQRSGVERFSMTLKVTEQES